jgi:hypothetical protein
MDGRTENVQRKSAGFLPGLVASGPRPTLAWLYSAAGALIDSPLETEFAAPEGGTLA